MGHSGGSTYIQNPDSHPAAAATAAAAAAAADAEEHVTF